MIIFQQAQYTVPYISVTRSYAVAWHYAVFNSKREPTPEIPAYIYEIVIDDTLPHGLNLLDLVKEVVHILPQPLLWSCRP